MSTRPSPRHTAPGASRVLTTLACLAALGAAASPAARAKDDDHSPRKLLASVKVRLADAIGAALAAKPGFAIEAGLGHDDGKLTYEVEILGADGKLYEVELDAVTGKVLETEEENDARDLAEAKALQAMATGGTLQLADLARKAEAIFANATAVAAEIELGKHGPKTEVVLFQGKKLVKVKLDAATGKILGTKKLRHHEDADDDHGDDDHGDDDHGDDDDDHGEAHKKKGGDHDGDDDHGDHDDDDHGDGDDHGDDDHGDHGDHD